MRYDLEIIAEWVTPGSRVLDLGCGSGELLAYLKRQKQVRGSGIESVEAQVAECIEKGLQVLQGDINEEIRDYPDQSFDYVILSQTLQQVYQPQELIRELLRVGKQVIVSFPNFSHWSIRLQLLIRGYAPKNRQLPYDWYDTPNIRVITLMDFRHFAQKFACRIDREAAVKSPKGEGAGQLVRFLPNLRATYGIFLISQR
ncbi:MAG: methionine biosynthesis protein MetW [Desulfobulbaceae bacterium]|nr:methionine biosynthesis protein MetW [Desulfobulbaceae bacterium]